MQAELANLGRLSQVVIRPGAEERSINGVLGGYAVLHAPDVADSTAFLQGPPGERPQDFGTIDESIISAE